MIDKQQFYCQKVGDTCIRKNEQEEKGDTRKEGRNTYEVMGKEEAGWAAKKTKGKPGKKVRMK